MRTSFEEIVEVRFSGQEVYSCSEYHAYRPASFHYIYYLPLTPSPPTLTPSRPCRYLLSTYFGLLHLSLSFGPILNTIGLTHIVEIDALFPHNVSMLDHRSPTRQTLISHILLRIRALGHYTPSKLGNTLLGL